MLTNTYECLAITLRSLRLVANCIRKPIRRIFATFWRICREYFFLHSQGYSPQCESSIKVKVTMHRGLLAPILDGKFAKCIGLKPQSHQACDQVTTYLRPKNGPIVERTYDWWQRSYEWWQRSWVIARGKSVATRS